MESLTKRVSTTAEEQTEVVEEEETTDAHPDKARLEELLMSEDHQQAFFLARRLVANGEQWAEEFLNIIKEKM